MRINNSFVNFKGYKNVISSSFSNNNINLTGLMLQLTDSDDHKDLCDINNILSKVKPNINNTDVFVLNLLKNKNKNQEYITINNIIIPSGKFLSQIRDNVDMEKMHLYKKEESIVLKAYTLLASLTTRILSDSNSALDSDSYKIVQHAWRSYAELFKESKFALNFVQDAVFRKNPMQKNASIINAFIQKTMNEYLKVR